MLLGAMRRALGLCQVFRYDDSQRPNYKWSAAKTGGGVSEWPGLRVSTVGTIDRTGTARGAAMEMTVGVGSILMRQSIWGHIIVGFW
jgi:hypothetical protein